MVVEGAGGGVAEKLDKEGSLHLRTASLQHKISKSQCRDASSALL